MVFRRLLVPFLLIITSAGWCSGVAQADEIRAIGELQDELFRLHESSPESLSWRLPNVEEVQDYSDTPEVQGGCVKPVPVRIHEPPRFVVRCIGSKGRGLRQIAYTTYVIWSYVDGEWAPGQIYRLEYDMAYSYDNRNREVWDRYSGLVGPLERVLVKLSKETLEELAGSLAIQFDSSDEIVESLNRWSLDQWPQGLVAVDKEGNFLVQRGSLTGVHSVVQAVSEESRLPEPFKGLVRVDYLPKPTKGVVLLNERSRGVTAAAHVGFIVERFDVYGDQFVLALTRLTANEHGKELFWRAGDYGIWLHEIQRDL